MSRWKGGCAYGVYNFSCSPINSAFATELGDFIADSRIDCWIYGHSHTSIDTQIGDTKIVSNQLGYVFQQEHLHNWFSHVRVIDV